MSLLKSESNKVFYCFAFGLNLTLLATTNQFFSGCLNPVDLRHTHKSFMGLYFEGWLLNCPLDKKKSFKGMKVSSVVLILSLMAFDTTKARHVTILEKLLYIFLRFNCTSKFV